MAQTKISTAKPGEKDDAGKAPANIPAATDFSTSGAPRQVTDFDPSHPAVDDNPRKDTTLDQNRIDFNDPTLSESEAVAKAMAEQGSGDIAKIPDADK
ncbi:hypothetical protein [Chenggangzhangella methanolivorans]|uniref:Uncharacterized protein n=1 Tax=Chenggangzhangella methanolivorans TaxID=1437009 RepID=A0A9E6ULZ8_9HYPH|nr:hypothetical protein [Chenggangzhangella methanolivorans]QZN99535.1 hypothetical protein K6K41_22965 [Chenggangzhangella methanolivorans]